MLDDRLARPRNARAIQVPIDRQTR